MKIETFYRFSISRLLSRPKSLLFVFFLTCFSVHAQVQLERQDESSSSAPGSIREQLSVPQRTHRWLAIMKADRFASEGKWGEAGTEIRGILRKQPASMEMFLKAAQLFTLAADKAYAESYWDRLSSEGHLVGYSQQGEANLHFRLGKEEEAVQFVLESITNRPASLRARLVAAGVKIQNRADSKAEQLVAGMDVTDLAFSLRWLATSGETPGKPLPATLDDANRERLFRLVMTGRIAWQKTFEMTPENFLACAGLLERGWRSLSHYNGVAAEKAFREARERGILHPELGALLGLAIACQGDAARMEAVFAELAAEQTPDPRVRYNWIRARLEVGNAQGALELLNGLPGEVKAAPDFRLLSAYISGLSGNDAEAMEILKGIRTQFGPGPISQYAIGPRPYMQALVNLDGFDGLLIP